MNTGNIDETPPQETGRAEEAQDYLLTWDTNERDPLSSDELAIVRQMLGGLGLRVSVVYDRAAAGLDHVEVKEPFDSLHTAQAAHHGPTTGPTAPASLRAVVPTPKRKQRPPQPGTGAAVGLTGAALVGGPC
jgi:hypothetical protein